MEGLEVVQVGVVLTADLVVPAVVVPQVLTHKVEAVLPQEDLPVPQVEMVLMETHMFVVLVVEVVQQILQVLVVQVVRVVQ